MLKSCKPTANLKSNSIGTTCGITINYLVLLIMNPVNAIAPIVPAIETNINPTILTMLFKSEAKKMIRDTVAVKQATAIYILLVLLSLYVFRLIVIPV